MCLGIPGKITKIYKKDSLTMGIVDFGGISREVCMDYAPEAQVGQYALIHVGFAISRIDESEAQEIFSYLEQIGEADDRDSATEGTS